jgi:hypothetical protein
MAVRQRRAGARVFLSLHANEGPPGVSGCETWVHPMSTGSARRLAERVQGAIGALTGRGGGVKTGAMTVLDPRRLGAADACLVEVEHLTSGVGERRLSTDRELDAMADAVAGAVHAHLKTGRYGKGAPKLTAGEYSIALDEYLRIVIDDGAEETIRVALFRRSPSFMAVVKRLDGKTVSTGSDLDSSISSTDVSQGRITGGKHVGKWRITFTAFVNMGHRFMPATSPEAPWEANFIVVEERGGANGPDRGRFVEAVVHETMHLDAAVFDRFKPAGTNLDQKIDAFFDEEIWVRRQTLAMMTEITKGNPTDLSGFTTPTPPVARADVERDFPSGSDRMTYLETIVLENLIADAIAAESITPTQYYELSKQVEGESVGPGENDMLQNMGGFVLVFDPQRNLYVTPATKTLELLMRRKATQAHWKLLFDNGLSAADQEAAAQKHASLLFPSGIKYH